MLLVIGVGVLCGALLLVRPANSFFLPAVLLLLLYNPERRRWQWRPALGFAVSVLVVLSPWLIRNYRCGLGPFTLSTQGGLAMWWGNNPQTRNGGFGTARFPEEEKKGELARNRFYQEKVFAWLRANPGRYTELCGVRAVRWFGTEADYFAARFMWPTAKNDRAVLDRYLADKGQVEVPEEQIKYALAVEKRNERCEQRLRCVTAPLLLLALVWSLFRWRKLGWVCLPALCYSVGLTVTIVATRYRTVSDPLFVILLAILLSDIVFGTRDLGGGRGLRVVKAALAILVVGASIYVHNTGLDKTWYNLKPFPQPQTAPADGSSSATQRAPSRA